ncbi:MAG TPA: hypothetical protein VH637_22650 [Streptosporangiaceae bacterium]|jgi:hypothetical protein
MGWSGFLPGVVGNLLADLIFALLAAAVAIALGNLFWRRGVRRFFNIPRGKGRLPIFLSNIVVQKSGTIGTGTVAEGFHGTAITEVEYACALNFASQIETKPVYRALRALDPDDLFVRVDPVVCRINISPKATVLQEAGNSEITSLVHHLIRNRSAITVGAPIYNVLTYHLMDEIPSHFSFIRREDNGLPVRGIKIRNYRGGEREYLRHPEGSRQVEYFIVEKLTWHDQPGGGRARDTKIFICAGTCSAATAAALQILADWRSLRRVSGGRDFAYLYELYLDSVDGREMNPPDAPQQVYAAHG